MLSWEQATSSVLDGIGLRSIKSRILVFALSATLIPSVTMGWLSYRNNRLAIDEKIVQELSSLTSHASREFELWLQERRYEMKVLSNSYEVSENLVQLNRPGSMDPSKTTALKHLEDYLGSVGDRFTVYEELLVVDRNGDVLASSREPSGALDLTEELDERIRAYETVIGSPYWDEILGAGVMIIAEPIRDADDSYLGAMGAKVNVDQIGGILTTIARDPSHELFLVTGQGEIVISSRDLDGPFMSTRLDPATVGTLFRRESLPLQFRSYRGTAALGALEVVPGLGWGVVAEMDRATAYAAIVRLRNVTLLLSSILVLVICLYAYLLGLTIVGPLNRLTEGAAKVAGGDLKVNLPPHGRSEVGYLTRVFNEMVARLRSINEENVAVNRKLVERNQELRTLSITDSLTGLFNRTELPAVLARELARSRRHEHAFSILMIDIDHFKRFNDSRGHQEGDQLLRSVAQILKGSLRACDVAARYGGEEFLILLTETDSKGALSRAEKIRGEVKEMRSGGKRAVTVSVGVASFPEHGSDVDVIIRHADAALYRCKRAGRNQVALARTGRESTGISRASSS